MLDLTLGEFETRNPVCVNHQCKTGIPNYKDMILKPYSEYGSTRLVIIAAPTVTPNNDHETCRQGRRSKSLGPGTGS